MDKNWLLDEKSSQYNAQGIVLIVNWKRIFTTIKEYGMNHVRFHSWCPPEAAFEAGDEVGMYLQAELPMWIKDVGKYPDRRDFFEKEMYAILDAYAITPLSS